MGAALADISRDPGPADSASPDVYGGEGVSDCPQTLLLLFPVPEKCLKRRAAHRTCACSPCLLVRLLLRLLSSFLPLFGLKQEWQRTLI